MLSSFWAITKNSLTEIVRQPVYGILLLVGVALIGGSPAITMFSMASDETLMVDIGLATVLLLGLVIAVLSATQVISREIEVQTVGAIISKPVGRFAFVLGKFAAVSLAMALVCYVLAVVLLSVLRIGVPSKATWRMDYVALVGCAAPLILSMLLALYCNFFYRWSFTSTAIMLLVPLLSAGFGLMLLFDSEWHLDVWPAIFEARHGWQVAQASFLVFLGVWVLSSVAVAASTRLNVVVNAIVCVAVFFVGMTSQFLFGRFAAGVVPAWSSLGGDSGGETLVNVGSAVFAAACWVLVRVVPNLHLFWVGDQLVTEIPFIPMGYVACALAYAVGFCGAMVALAAFLFEKREVV